MHQDTCFAEWFVLDVSEAARRCGRKTKQHNPVCQNLYAHLTFVLDEKVRLFADDFGLEETDVDAMAARRVDERRSLARAAHPDVGGATSVTHRADHDAGDGWDGGRQLDAVVVVRVC